MLVTLLRALAYGTLENKRVGPVAVSAATSQDKDGGSSDNSLSVNAWKSSSIGQSLAAFLSVHLSCMDERTVAINVSVVPHGGSLCDEPTVTLSKAAPALLPLALTTVQRHIPTVHTTATTARQVH